MLIIQKLYLKEFFKLLFLLSIGLSAVFSLIAMLDKIGELISHKPKVILLIKYYLFSIPKLLYYLLPMSVLLSGLYVFSLAVKCSEIIIIKTSAGNIKKIFAPFIYIGILLTLFSFLLGEFVVPYSVKAMNETKNVITKKQRKYAVREGVVYLRGKDGSIVKVGRFFPDNNTISDITVYRYSEKGLYERIDAQNALWDNNQWIFSGVTLIDIEKGIFTNQKTMLFTALESPRLFMDDIHNVEEMSISELFNYKKRLNEAGFKNARLTTYLHSRLSYSLVNLFMTVLGLSIALGGLQFTIEKIFHGSLAHTGAVSAGIGFIISLIYWIGYTFFISFGYAGTIPASFAPWIMPTIMTALTFYLYRHMAE